MVNRDLFRFSATLLLVGVFVWVLAGLFHAGVDPNNHPAEFAAYASSSIWTAVHLGQFLGIAILVAGLVVLFFTLDVNAATAGWISRFGAISAVVALALYAVLQAVDGVALKQAVDAWANAPDAEKLVRFASAESIRWLEWGVRSYHSFMLGLAFLLFAAAIVMTGKFPKAIGYLIALSGLAYIAQGWVLGNEGFSQANTIPNLLGIVLILLWPIWLSIVAWRGKEDVQTIHS